MDKLSKCLCCGGTSLHKGSSQKSGVRGWWSEKYKGIFSKKGFHSIYGVVCADCGYLHWFADGNVHELKEM